ncbi:hypothetical protein ACFPYI_11840 [Halomarina salina]|uniref:Uncharacterized protein n=1 Tax=Halomarina salina TaxID=1872699 RepID=A0ABD5RMY8_9EURY|nr:hypothetical protein [Halomarina salina]
MDETPRAGDGGSPAVAATLQRLKREGASLLVTGEVGRAVRAQQTRRLLGSPSEERARVLALADDSSPSQYLPHPVTPTDDRVTVVEHADPLRSGATASAEPAPLNASVDPLADFHAATLAAIDAEGDAPGAFAPAELRVGLVGLGTLTDRYGPERCGRVVRSLGAAVREHRGMYHCHVAGPTAAPTVRTLQSAFDARIDLRQRDGLPPEQRWSFIDSDESTEWMLL